MPLERVTPMLGNKSKRNRGDHRAPLAKRETSARRGGQVSSPAMEVTPAERVFTKEPTRTFDERESPLPGGGGETRLWFTTLPLNSVTAPLPVALAAPECIMHRLARALASRHLRSHAWWKKSRVWRGRKNIFLQREREKEKERERESSLSLGPLSCISSCERGRAAPRTSVFYISSEGILRTKAGDCARARAKINMIRLFQVAATQLGRSVDNRRADTSGSTRKLRKWAICRTNSRSARNTYLRRRVSFAFLHSFFPQRRSPSPLFLFFYRRSENGTLFRFLSLPRIAANFERIRDRIRLSDKR